ncbi:MAG: discoidin domain-containing protein [Planctomycetaceae bacterium]|nr:discoidin domain-containing protein [Planctomycetaceae bacterium]
MQSRISVLLFLAFLFTATPSHALEVRVTADSMRYPDRDGPQNVIDGSIADTSRWVSRGTRGLADGSDPHWLALEFDSPIVFDRVQLLTGSGNIAASALVEYAIEVETDGRWVELAHGAKNQSLNIVHSFPETRTQKLRVRIPQGGARDSYARVKEIRLYYGDRQVVPETVYRQRQYFAAPPITGREDEFCRRAHAIMLRGAAFAKDLYRQWPVEAECGYLGWGGHGEKEIMANIGMSHLYAFLLTFGQYDERVTGVSRQEALRRVKGVVRYCCYTHFSGSHACVDGDTWGGGWHDADWSAILAHTAWLVWDQLDEPTREMAARVIAAEADRFADAEPPSGKIDNTRAEENAWNTRAPAIASVMFPGHPHAEAWRLACRRWLMNCLTVAADRNDATMVDGRPVNQWVTTENIHSDFTLENHRIVYPVYMWATMVNMCQSAGYHVYAGIEPPQAAFHHLGDVYGVYKRMQTWEGLPAYVNGSDKFLHLQVVDIFMHSFFAQVLGDREAAHLEDVELGILERMQSRFSDGRLYPEEEVGPWSRVNNLSFILGGSYLLHYVLQNDVKPVSTDEFERRISGVSYFPDGKFLLHRTPNKLVSFAWSKPYRIMGLAIPREGSWLVTPNAHGFTGTILEEGTSKEPPWELEDLDFTQNDDSFIVRGRALRCQGKVRYSWTFHSLPEDEVVVSQKLVAVQPVTLARVETGTVGIGRDLGREEIRLQWDSQEQTLGGPDAGEDRLLQFTGSSLTVDERFEYEWSGQGVVCYLKRGRPARVHGAPGGYGHIEDELHVGHLDKPQAFDCGQTIAEGILRVRMLSSPAHPTTPPE